MRPGYTRRAPEPQAHQGPGFAHITGVPVYLGPTGYPGYARLPPPKIHRATRVHRYTREMCKPGALMCLGLRWPSGAAGPGCIRHPRTRSGYDRAIRDRQGAPSPRCEKGGPRTEIHRERHVKTDTSTRKHRAGTQGNIRKHSVEETDREREK